MGERTRYNDFARFLALHFPFKVQKISLNVGFTCPNRDGVKGYGGCTYCNNQTFNPAYCRTDKSVTQQLEEGKEFFARKYPEMKFLAYFQAYTIRMQSWTSCVGCMKRHCGRRSCRTRYRYASRLYARRIAGLSGRVESANLSFSGIWY